MDEVTAEVNLHIAKHFIEDPHSQVIPTLDYKAHGFKRPGVTVLLGGDHGDKKLSNKRQLNLTSPEHRKHDGDLNKGCPMVQFASVECTKDTYSMLNNRIMPKVKEDIKALQNSAILTVYRSQNVQGNFRSYHVPTDIHQGTIAFLREQGDGGRNALAFGHGQQTL